MGIAKKIFLAFLVLVVLLFLLPDIWALTYKPSFEVRSVEIVNHEGYPCVRLSFRTSDYPVKFYLLTDKGEKIDSESVYKPEEAVYLRLSSWDKNVVGPRRYVVKAFYNDKELWSGEVKIEGASADIDITGIEPSIDSNGLTVKGIYLEVRNRGDVPLYLSSYPSETIKLYLDGSPEHFNIEHLVLMPGESLKVKLGSFIEIPYYELYRAHEIRLSILRVAEASYTIKALEPKVRIDKVVVTQRFTGQCVDSITLTISNTWNYSIDIEWAEIHVDGKKASLWSHPFEKVNPGENRTITLDLVCEEVPKQFIVTVKLGRTEVSYSG
ncbi:MAG: hypothetical protein DSO07_06300 [Thermoproteota archaeon]|jgi:hypothetical protein|nr:MAG: hypothetical protein DSO07_06300 [Candidatus Korarchaeota archaeon]